MKYYFILGWFRFLLDVDLHYHFDSRRSCHFETYDFEILKSEILRFLNRRFWWFYDFEIWYLRFLNLRSEISKFEIWDFENSKSDISRFQRYFDISAIGIFKFVILRCRRDFEIWDFEISKWAIFRSRGFTLDL